MSADLSLSIGCTRRWYSNSLWLDRHALPISVGAVDLTLPVHDLLHRALRRHVRAVSHLDACAGRNKHFATLGLSLHVVVPLYPIQTDSACGSYHRFKASCIRPPPVVETSWSLTSNQLYTETTPDPPPFRRRSGHASTRARGCCTAPCRLSWMLHAPIDSNHCVPPLTFRPDAEPPTHPHGMKDVPQQGYCVSVFPPSYGCVFLMHTSRHPSKRRHI